MGFLEVRQNPLKLKAKQIVFICDFCQKLSYREYEKIYTTKPRLFCSRSCNCSWSIANKILDCAGEKNINARKAIYALRTPEQKLKIREKIVATTVKNHGVRVPSQSMKIQEKIKSTNIKRYGVDNVLKLPEIQEKIKSTNTKKYGCPIALSNHEIYRKTTIRFDGTNRNISRIELEFGKILKEIYGTNNVESQIRINNWIIDFYVGGELNTYIQFDGVYWHGLDRSIDLIKTSDSPRDKCIYNHYVSDLCQNDWFSKNEKKLVRITDKEFKRCSDTNGVKDLIKEKLKLWVF